MAEFVRAKAEVKAEERREGESLGLEGADLLQHINREVDLFIAREREEAERALAKEKAEREMAKEQVDREHALRLVELEIEKERVQAERTTTPVSNLVLDSRTGQVHHSLLFPLDPFDEKLESIEVYLDRFEQIAKMYELPEDKWNLRLAHVLKGKAYEVYSKLAEEDTRNYAALRAALLVRYELTASTYRKKFRTARLEKSETYSQLLVRLTKYLNKWRTLGKYPETYQGVVEMILVEQMKECMTPDLRMFVEENGATHLDKVKELADRYTMAHRESRDIVNKKPASYPRNEGKREERAAGLNPPINRSGSGNSPNRTFARPAPSPRRSRTWCEYHQTSSHSSEDCRRRNAQTSNPLTPTPKPSRHMMGAVLSKHTPDSAVPFTSPACERVLVNGKPATCLNDTGCSYDAIVNKSLIQPEDMTGETVEIRTIGWNSPARTLPVAHIHVETSYVHGKIRAAVMDDSIYDLVLVCRYVYLGKPKYPITVAPVITRSRAKETESAEESISTPQEMKEAQRRDPSLSKWIALAEGGKPQKGKHELFLKNGLLYRRPKEGDIRKSQFIVPVEHRKEVLRIGHDATMSGHQGQGATMHRICHYYNWPGITQDIKRYVASCPECQSRSPKSQVPPVPLGKTPLIDTPFKRVSIDLLGPLPRTRKRNAYILCVVCQASRWAEAAALPSIDTRHVAEALFNIFTRIGFPEAILTDNGSQFTGKLMSEVYQTFNATHLKSSVYHPQANGLVERFNATLMSMLRKLSEGRPEEWDLYLPAALFAYREVPQASLGYSPYEVIFGSQPRGPLELLRQNWTKEEVEEEARTVSKYVQDLRERLHLVRTMAMENLKKARQRQERNYNRRAKDRDLQVGDKVLLLLPKNTNKLQICWRGPFEVTQKMSDTNYRVKIGNKNKVYHVNLLKRYFERETVGQALVAIAIAEDSGMTKGLTEYPMTQNEGVKDVTICPELSPEQQGETAILLERYPEVLTDRPGRTSLETFTMKLTDDRPINMKPYPVPHAKAGVIEEEAFNNLKKALIERPVLRLPNLDKDFILRTDASNVGLGAILLQAEEGSGPEPRLFPIAYASRKLSKAEQNYATVELECLALVWAVDKFQPYLYGKQFLLQTDHHPLSFLSSSKKLNARLMRWSLLLQPYTFRIEYIPGGDNHGPDYLSRHPHDSESEETPVSTTNGC